MNDTHISSLASQCQHKCQAARFQCCRFSDSNRFFRGCVGGGLGWVGLLGRQISEKVFEFRLFLVQVHL